MEWPRERIGTDFSSAMAARVVEILSGMHRIYSGYRDKEPR